MYFCLKMFFKLLFFLNLQVQEQQEEQ